MRSLRNFYGAGLVVVFVAVCFTTPNVAMAQDICAWMEEKGLVDRWMIAKGLDMSINPQAGGVDVGAEADADGDDEAEDEAGAD